MEAALAASKGWHLTWRFPLACLARDVIFVPIWLYAWFGKSVVWRGNPITIEARISRPVQEFGSTA